MMNPKIQEAFNKQLNFELFSAYLYLSMSAHFEAESFKGMAAWMRTQAQEEVGHAMRFYKFINDRNGRVTLAQIEAPKTQWSSPLEAFEDSYKHECKVTSAINDEMNLAMSERDHAAHTFLEWLINEQVEEEATVLTIVDQLKLVGDKGMALFLIDQQLGQRKAAAAAAPAAAV
jgi:ferritin